MPIGFYKHETFQTKSRIPQQSISHCCQSHLVPKVNVHWIHKRAETPMVKTCQIVADVEAAFRSKLKDQAAPQVCFMTYTRLTNAALHEQGVFTPLFHEASHTIFTHRWASSLGNLQTPTSATCCMHVKRLIRYTCHLSDAHTTHAR